MPTVYFPTFRLDQTHSEQRFTRPEALPTRALTNAEPAHVMGIDAQYLVVAREGKDRYFFDARRVPHFYAFGKRAAFKIGGRQFKVNESLGSLTERFQARGFVRVHRGDLINFSFLAAMRRSTTGQVVELADGQQVAVSRLLLPELRRRLRAHFAQ